MHPGMGAWSDIYLQTIHVRSLYNGKISKFRLLATPDADVSEGACGNVRAHILDHLLDGVVEWTSCRDLDKCSL